MDLAGQGKVETLIEVLLAIFALIGAVMGYFLHSFKVAAGTLGVGMVVCIVACVPDWPWFNENPIQFQPALGNHAADFAKGIRPSNSPEDKKTR